MRALVILVIVFQTLAATAANLDLAVIQFPEPKTAEELESSLRGVNLFEMTNSNRTMVDVPYLKGGTVLFAQTLSPSASFSSATRLGDNRADVAGQLVNNLLSVEITLSEGVASGLRRFVSRTYKGSAPLPPGTPRVISLRVISGKTQSASKGQASIKQTTTTNVIVAQLRP